ncbi:hypothetical protein [Mesotoga sp.]|uniref:hypothetical protein n=1 Tax=Mesotoga sp. TaxID=2053577 RepID=UPI00345EC554
MKKRKRDSLAFCKLERKTRKALVVAVWSLKKFKRILKSSSKRKKCRKTLRIPVVVRKSMTVEIAYDLMANH